MLYIPPHFPISSVLQNYRKKSHLTTSSSQGFFWAGICFLCIIYTYFRVPEPRGRSFAELDLLFERGVSARKFSSTKVDVFEDDVSEYSTFEGTAGKANERVDVGEKFI